MGIADSALSERLQLDPDLSLEKTKKCIRQREAVKEQHRKLQDCSTKTNPIVLDEVRDRRPSPDWTKGSPQKFRKGMTPTSQKPQRGFKGPGKDRLCKRCGKDHPAGKCPARGVTCFKCSKKGHFQTQCLTKTLAATTQERDVDTAFLGTLNAGQPSTCTWFTTLELNGQEVNFKLNTGAEVTAISNKTYTQLQGVGRLKAASKVLYGPTQQPLQVLGQFEATLAKKQKGTSQTVFVIRGLKTNLLGLPAINALQLVSRIDSTAKASEDILQKFPSLFCGLGNLGEEYRIKLKPGVQPYALFTPRNVPIPLRPKVKEELLQMENLGVISRVTIPTPWCAGMVVVPKKSGDVRICVDLKPLNEGVLRETHPIPSVDDTLAQLAGAKIFSKVDANSGFWQIPLSKDSCLLTTFITPFWRYCFNKLPFGISSAPELYQRRMSQILDGLEGVVCHIDDTLISNTTLAEHNSRLHAVLSRLQTAGVTLNAKKCKFHQDSIQFLGHIINHDGVRPDPEKISAIIKLKTPTTITELR